MAGNQNKEKKKKRAESFLRAIESLDLDNPNATISVDLDYDKGNLSRYMTGKVPPPPRLVQLFEEKYNLKIEDFEKEEHANTELNMLHESKATEYKTDQEIPLYDIEVTAGVVSLFQNPQTHKIIDTIRIPNMPKSDGAIIVTGDSMYPIIKSGDIVIYKTITDLPQSIFFGNTYIVSIDVEGDEYTVVKYVKEGKDSNHILLVSENQHHADKEIHIKHINGMALVKASVRFNSLT